MKKLFTLNPKYSIIAILLLLGFQSWAQPANNECSAAQTLTVGATCVPVAGTNVAATQSIASITCGGFTSTSALDVWYQFVATATAINVTVVGGTGLDVIIDVRSGACDGTNIACADATTSAGTEVASLAGLTIGNTYLVRVYGWGGGTGTFTICANTPPPPPANDNCAGAIALTVNADFLCASSAAGTTVSATASTETAPSCSATGVNDDVWYSFTATAATHRVAITGATNTTAAAVYSGLCGALTQLPSACNSTLSGALNLNLTGLTAGTTYLVRVYTTSATAGITSNFTICIGSTPPPPVNDECINAIQLTVNPDLNCGTVTPGTTTSATGTADATCTGTEDDDVWFKFTATATSHKIDLLNVVGSVTDMAHQVLSACGGMSLLCSDPNTSTVSGLTIGNMYFLRVYTFTSTGGQSTTFNVCIGTAPPPPANDDCVNATTLTVNADLNCGTVTPGTVVSATGVADATCTGTEDDDVWFKFIATATSHKIDLLNVTGSTTDLVHQVLSACGGTNLLCSDPNTSTVSGLTIGNEYLLRVYTWTSTTGQTSSFNVCIGTFPPPPANDECAGAIPLSVGISCNFNQYTNVGATGSVGPPAPGCSSFLGGDVWFSAIVPATGRLIIDTNTGVITDGGMAIYSGNCGVLTLIECDDDDSANGLMPLIDRSGLTPGSTIYIRFFEFGNDNNGTFSICAWAPAPPCNAPGIPVVSNITSNSASVSWSAAAGAVSYDWTVGTGASCPTGTGANTAATSINLSNLIPNTTYRVCVRTSTCGGGSASSYETVTFSTAPLANDACAGAIPLVCNSTVNGSTVGAVSDSGQGSCGSAGVPGNGVWYSLAGDGSQITLDLCGSAYDTKIHVYSGSCAGLACVISNDDNAAICTSATTRSQVVFNTTAGTTYYILVSGFGTATGAFSMNVGCVCGAPLSFPWSNNAIGAGTTGEGIDNVCGGSIDISSTGYSPSLASDALFFSSQSLCGNQSITVKVQSITNGGFAGIMFRDSVNAGSRFVAIKTQLNPFVHREMRTVLNGVRQVQQLPAHGHTWLRLTRSGNTFTGFTSHNGVNWSQAFSVNVVLNSCIRVGLFAQGLNPSSTAQARFSMITGFPPAFIPILDINTSVNEGTQGLTVFPNPTSNELNLKIGTEYLGKNITINVMDQMGRTVLRRNINELQTQMDQINVSNLPAGMYILSLVAEGQTAQVQKFIVSGNRP